MMDQNNNKPNNQDKPLPLKGQTLSQIQNSNFVKNKSSSNPDNDIKMNVNLDGDLSSTDSLNASPNTNTQNPSSLPPLPKDGEELSKNQKAPMKSNDSKDQEKGSNNEMEVKINQEEKEGLSDQEDSKEKPKKKKNKFRPINSIIKTIQGIRKILTAGCLTIFILAVVFLITIIFRPPITWNPLKSFLNGDFQPQEVEPYTAEQTLNYIDSVFTESQGSTITLTESQVTALLRSKLGEGEEQIVDFEPGVMRIIANGDSNRGDPPLWLIVEMTEDSSNQLSLTKIGFGRFGLPKSLNDNIGDFIFRAMSLAQGQFDRQDSAGLIEFLVAKDTSVPVTIQDVRFDKNNVVITYDVYNPS